MKNKKIEEMIKNGRAIPLEDILAKESDENRKRIYERAKYLSLAMELRKLRKKSNLSQAALAGKIKSKREFISRIESGKQNVTLETLFRIAEAFGKRFEFSFG